MLWLRTASAKTVWTRREVGTRSQRCYVASQLVDKAVLRGPNSALHAFISDGLAAGEVRKAPDAR